MRVASGDGASDATPGAEARPPRASGVAFVTTHWALVLSAGRAGTDESRRALETLCGQYWDPLYAFVRQQGYSADDAGELTQEFFLRLLAKNGFATADPDRGRFRSWLLGALKHFLANERDRASARKRGGGRPVQSIEASPDLRRAPVGQSELRDAETRYAREPAHRVTPDKVFDRRWALALLGGVLARLRAEMEADGKGPLFEALKDSLGGGNDVRSHRDVANSLGMTEGAVRVAAHRLRRRYRELLRAEIAQTVLGPGEVDDEIRHLFAALA